MGKVSSDNHACIRKFIDMLSNEIKLKHREKPKIN